MVLEKTLENPLDCKEIKPVNSNGNQFRIFTGGNGAEAETPILWPPDAKNWLTGKGCWEGLKEGGEGRDRGWDGLMASQTQWTWVWTNSRSYWWTGKLGVLQSLGSQSQTQLSDWSELPEVSTQYYYEIVRGSKLLYIPIHSLSLFSLSPSPLLLVFLPHFFFLSFS